MIILYEYFFQPLPTSIGYYYVYGTYLITILGFYFGYTLKLKLPEYKFINHQEMLYTRKLRMLSVVFFISAWIIYMPILIEFKDFLLNPREIYIRTRSGYGLTFFLSTTMIYISLVLTLFSFKNKFYLSIFFILLILFGYLHGSKGMIVMSTILLGLFIVYVKKVKISLSRLFVIVAFFSFFLISAFLFTSVGLDSLLEVIKMMSAYSDYTRNSIDLINNFDSMFQEPFWGQLTFESNFWSRVPRLLFEDKPRAFGEFRLSEAMFPEWFAQNVGDASFGIMGIPFADFSYLGIHYIFLWSLLTGVIIKYLINILKHTANVGIFILLCFFAGYGFIATGAGWMIFEHLFLAFMVNKLINTKFVYKREGII
ncbi:O-antigen polymerase [Aliarcobacter cryaerophilus]|uniref:O-antigen polymerase n=1 Tax=Aliarcobacter cryaerophilus TaxID=28198 RepID=UPI003DA1D5E6